MTFKKILVAYDGSSLAEKALQYGIEQAKMTNDECQLVLLHVVPIIPITPMIDRPIRSQLNNELITLSEYTQELYKQMKERMIKILDDKKKECMSSVINSDSSTLSSSSRISVETAILVGDADDKMIEFANEKGVDLIVIGSRGLRGSGF